MISKREEDSPKTSSLFLTPNTFAKLSNIPKSLPLYFVLNPRFSPLSRLDRNGTPDLQQDYILNNSGGVQCPVGISNGVYSPLWTGSVRQIKAVPQPDE